MRDLGPQDGSGIGSGDPSRAGPIDVAIRLGVLAGFLLLVGVLLRPFLGLMIWAAILTVALSPVHDWMTRRMGGRAGLAAALLTGLALVVVFGPLAYVVANLVASLERLAATIGSGGVVLPPLPAAIGHLPVVGAPLTGIWSTGTSGLGDLLRTHGKDLLHPGEAVLKIVAALAGSVATFAVAVLAAGFLFVPGPRIVAVAQETATRIAGPRGTRFVALAGATVRGVARGIIGIAFLQAVLMGAVMVVAGIPHAGLLAVAVLVLSLAQVAALVVAVPVVVWVWVTHSTLFAAV
ncbi:MAG: AI-2E family transporter, partial [Mangrovicoccus sp.]|nr:AI-2E family transporter [Mangrovicoccus sp.]